MTVPALPWHHQTQASLAKALGVSQHALDQWKAKGAPLSSAGPHDELAMRLWHAAQATDSKGKAKALTAPGEAIRPYIELAAAAVEAQRQASSAAATDPGNLVKLGQARKLELANHRSEQVLLDQAKDAFRRWTGDLTQGLGRAFTVTILAELWKVCQSPRLRAEPALKRAILATCEAAVLATLTAAEADVTKAKAKR
jgi:hypothetical protein